MSAASVTDHAAPAVTRAQRVSEALAGDKKAPADPAAPASGKDPADG